MVGASRCGWAHCAYQQHNYSIIRCASFVALFSAYGVHARMNWVGGAGLGLLLWVLQVACSASLQPVVLGATKEAEDGALGCCIMTRRVEYIRGIPVRRVYLNTAGENAADDVCVEYNDILAMPEYKPEFVARLIARLKQS